MVHLVEGLGVRSSSLRRSFILFGKAWIAKKLGLTLQSKSVFFSTKLGCFSGLNER